MNYSLTKQRDWDSGWDKINKFEIVSKDSIIRKWLEKYFIAVKNGNKSVLEVGCFPGGYLAVFGELGYELNGIDRYARVNTDLPDWLRSKDYKIGDFHLLDFFEFKDNRKYDVVCSFGFLEHFTNFEEVLTRHASFVKEGGYLAITTPNYRGFIQKILHIILNTAMYRGYNIPSMNTAAWKKVVQKLGFEVIFSGGFGNFIFWTECDKRNFPQKILSRLIMKASAVLSFIRLPDSAMYSPYCGLIARKTPQSAGCIKNFS